MTTSSDGGHQWTSEDVTPPLVSGGHPQEEQGDRAETQDGQGGSPSLTPRHDAEMGFRWTFAPLFCPRCDGAPVGPPSRPAPHEDSD